MHVIFLAEKQSGTFTIIAIFFQNKDTVARWICRRIVKFMLQFQPSYKMIPLTSAHPWNLSVDFLISKDQCRLQQRLRFSLDEGHLTYDTRSSEKKQWVL